MDKIVGYVFGIASLLGFVISFYGLSSVLYKFEAANDAITFLDQLKDVYIILALCVLALIVFSAFLIFYYSNRITYFNALLDDLPIENEVLSDQVRELVFENVIVADMCHNILHYYRNILASLDYTIRRYQTEPDNLTKEDCNKILRAFDSFLQTLLTNISHYFGHLTNDKCASCIKIINSDHKIKTFYRDPISYRLRKISDYISDGRHFIYHVSDNFAFDVIIDDKFKQTTYICDDLKQAKSQGMYKNINQDWEKYYNACAVVPIRIRSSPSDEPGDQAKHLGFLCVDNFKGGFETRETKDFLSGFGDILYNLLEKYDQIVSLALEKGIENERLRAYTDWSAS